MGRVQSDVVALRYLEALKHIHENLTNNRSITMKEVMARFRLPFAFSKVIKEGGIIKGNGSRSYKWNSIPPSLVMAREVLKRVNVAKQNKYNEEPASETVEITNNQPDMELAKTSRIREIEMIKQIDTNDLLIISSFLEGIELTKSVSSISSRTISTLKNTIDYVNQLKQS